MKRMRFPGELSLAAGLILCSYAVPIMLHCGFGLSTITSFPYALSLLTDHLTFGQLNYLFQGALLAALVIITGRFKSSYLACFAISILYGIGIDFFTPLVASYPSSLPARLLLFALSCFMICAGTYFMIRSKMPLMADDIFTVEIMEHFHLPFWRIKTGLDIFCVAISLFTTVLFCGNLGGVGLGTIFMALTTGQGVRIIGKYLDPRLDIQPLIRYPNIVQKRGT